MKRLSGSFLSHFLFLSQKECIREHPKPQYFLRASISAARRISLWSKGKRKRFPLQPFAFLVLNFFCKPLKDIRHHFLISVPCQKRFGTPVHCTVRSKRKGSSFSDFHRGHKGVIFSDHRNLLCFRFCLDLVVA